MVVLGSLDGHSIPYKALASAQRLGGGRTKQPQANRNRAVAGTVELSICEVLAYEGLRLRIVARRKTSGSTDLSPLWQGLSTIPLRLGKTQHFRGGFNQAFATHGSHLSIPEK